MQSIEDQMNPLLMQLNRCRSAIEANGGADDWEREREEAVARSVLADSGIPKMFRSASAADFPPDSKVVGYIGWVKPNKKGLLIEGHTGAGKTHAACAIAANFAKTGRSVRFVSSVRLMDATSRRFDEGSRHYVNRCKNAALLIIDDLGKESLSDKTLPLLYELIDYRCANELTTIITTNYSQAELQKRYESIEPETGAAIMRRIALMCFHVVFGGCND